MSGLSRLLASAVTGPRLLKDARLSVPVLRAPTVYTAAYSEGGSVTVEQADPLFPAAATMLIPAASCASTPCWRVRAEQPSDAGQPQELVVTSGARLGSP